MFVCVFQPDEIFFFEKRQSENSYAKKHAIYKVFFGKEGVE